jgi:hypothetical protein
MIAYRDLTVVVVVVALAVFRSFSASVAMHPFGLARLPYLKRRNFMG